MNFTDSVCRDRKSTRLNSSHPTISYAVFCLKKKKTLKPDGNLAHEPLCAARAHTACMRWRDNEVCVAAGYHVTDLDLLWKIDFFFFNDTATTEIYTLSLHDALPILSPEWPRHWVRGKGMVGRKEKQRH